MNLRDNFIMRCMYLAWMIGWLELCQESMHKGGSVLSPTRATSRHFLVVCCTFV